MQPDATSGRLHHWLPASLDAQMGIRGSTPPDVIADAHVGGCLTSWEQDTKRTRPVALLARRVPSAHVAEHASSPSSRARPSPLPELECSKRRCESHMNLHT